MPGNRHRMHLGLDYGTSAAKMVVRDFGAAGEDEAHVVLRSDGSFRFPSGVASGGGFLWFGLSPEQLNGLGLSREMRLHESVKMLCAQELDPGVAVLHLPEEPTPHTDLTWVDLASLTVWWLVSEGTRFARRLLPAGDELSLGMTMGAPTSFLQNPPLMAGFLRIARTGWALFKRNGSLEHPFLTVARARRELANLRGSVDVAPPAGSDTRNWVRSEAEGALWWAFQSPSVGEGPFIKIDVGAGTTSVSLFRIVGKHLEGRWVKSTICFFSAVSGTEGMDAIDACLARACGIEDQVALRGRESQIARDLGDSAATACESAIGAIGSTVSRAWDAADPRIGHNTERAAWDRDCRALLLGGGATFMPLRQEVQASRFRYGRSFSALPLEPPADLRVGPRPVPQEHLRFLLSAYGLSVLGLAIPEVDSADDLVEVPTPVRQRREWDDTYAK